MKRSPLKRGKPLARGTKRLRRVTPLRASIPSPRRPRDSGPSPKVRAIVRERSGAQCEFTGCDAAAGHVHHRRPRQVGSSTDPTTNALPNLLHVCAPCHAWIESNRAKAYVRGLLVRRGDDPAVEPVETRHGWVILDDQGGWRAAP